MTLWRHVITSPSVSDYEKHWFEFQHIYREYPEILRYLINTWLKDHKEKFVHCWADRYPHFGHHETSRAEGAHSVIKRYLQVSTGDLHNVLEKLSLMLTANHREHNAAISTA